jgi:hypothetical protein
MAWLLDFKVEVGRGLSRNSPLLIDGNEGLVSSHRFQTIRNPTSSGEMVAIPHPALYLSEKERESRAMFGWLSALQWLRVIFGRP